MDNTKEHKKMKSTALKKHVAAEKYMANTKPERHTREDNINIKGSTCLWSACIVLLLLLNMYLSVRWIIYSLFNKTIIIKKNHKDRGHISDKSQVWYKHFAWSARTLFTYPLFYVTFKEIYYLFSFGKSVHGWGAR